LLASYNPISKTEFGNAQHVFRSSAITRNKKNNILVAPRFAKIAPRLCFTPPGHSMAPQAPPTQTKHTANR